MDKKLKQNIWLVILGIILFVTLNNLKSVLAVLKHCADIIKPAIFGAIFALFLIVPIRGLTNSIENRITKKGKQANHKIIRIICIVIVLITTVLIIALLATLIIPELVKTVSSIITLIQNNWPKWVELLEKYNINTSGIKEMMSSLNFETILSSITGTAGSVIDSVISAATTTLSGAFTFLSSIIFALYVIFESETLSRQFKKLVKAYLNKSTADRILNVTQLIDDTFTKFLTGQCFESLILGLLIALGFTIARLSYAPLIGVATAISAMIPYVGAFLSCGLAIILTLMIAPQKVIICVIVYGCIQFIENQFIYPRVIGNSVGLSPLWTLFAVLLGGSLFGIMGMIFFIPLLSVVYTLISDDVNDRLNKQQPKNLS